MEALIALAGLRLERHAFNLNQPKTVYPELVEGLLFPSCLARNCLKKKQSFDKLRIVGVRGEVIHIS